MPHSPKTSKTTPALSTSNARGNHRKLLCLVISQVLSASAFAGSGNVDITVDQAADNGIGGAGCNLREAILTINGFTNDCPTTPSTAARNRIFLDQPYINLDAFQGNVPQIEANVAIYGFPSAALSQPTQLRPFSQITFSPYNQATDFTRGLEAKYANNLSLENVALFGQGVSAGIGGDIDLLNVEISGFPGLAMSSSGNTSTIRNSSINGGTGSNTAIYAGPQSTLTIQNSTISGNSGGGVFSSGDDLTISYSTVFYNGATGITLRNGDGTVTLRNSIVAYHNTNCSNQNDNGGNFGVFTDAGTSNVISDLTCTGASNGPVSLAPLAANGGTTRNHEPRSGSAAVDVNPPISAYSGLSCPRNLAGYSSESGADQRGLTGPIDGNFDGTTGCDLGAVEANPMPATITVSTGDDIVAVDSLCSLREALGNANSDSAVNIDCISGSAPGDTIEFDPSVTTATLTAGVLTVTDDLVVRGNDRFETIIDAGTGSQVFTANGSALTLSRMTLENGYSIGFGGAVSVYTGELNLTDVIIQNSTAAVGGGISTYQTTVTVTDSTFLGNTGSLRGGAIEQYGTSTLTITGSSFSGNSAGNSGGALYHDASGAGAIEISASSLHGNTSVLGGALSTVNGGSASLINTTIAANSSTNGGIYARASTLDLAHVTVIENTGIVGQFNIDATSTLVLANSAIGNAATSANCYIQPGGTLTVTGNNFDDDSSCATHVDDLQLLDLGHFAAGLSAPPATTSPLLDAADPTICAATAANADQLAVGRRPIGAACDIGAVERPQTIAVTSTDDAPVATITDECTLRDAVMSANTNTSVGGCTAGVPGFDYIQMDHLVTQFITLVEGEITIAESTALSVTGDYDMTVFGNGSSRLFRVDNAVSNRPMLATFHNMTLTNGNETSPDGGGAIFTREHLTLTDVRVAGNSATYSGGGISAISALTQGFNAREAGSITVGLQRSQVDSNEAGISSGGLRAFHAAIDQSTVANNSASTYGSGGLALFRDSNIVNSTISGNSANGFGGGLSISGGTLTMRNATIADNSSTQVTGGQMLVSNATLDVSYSIIDRLNAGGQNCFVNNGVLSGTGNMVSDATCGNGISSSGVLPLTSNRSEQYTHALEAASPAVDALDTSLCPPTDQRGAVRVGDCDIGAFEIIPMQISVDFPLDVFDPTDNLCSLREAASNANGDNQLSAIAGECEPGLGVDNIVFEPLPTAFTISLANGEIALTDSVSIAGPGADQLTIAATGSGIFSMDDPFDTGELFISGLTLAGGSAPIGGAIAAEDRVALYGVHLTGNSAQIGGGLFASSGQIIKSTFSNNTASHAGGGIFVAGSPVSNSLVVSSSTFSGNTAPHGAAINGYGQIELSSSTVFNHTGATTIETTEPLILNNTIVAGSSGANCMADPAASIGPSLADDATCGATLSGPAVLGPLANNGGPTPTHLPLSSSSAIDNGDCLPGTDQRGFARPIGDCDVGAVELANRYPLVTSLEFNLPAPPPNGTQVAAVTAIDPDGDDLVAYMITAGNPDNAFSIDNTGAITVADSTALGNDVRLVLTIAVTDDMGQMGVGTATITIGMLSDTIFADSFED